MTTIARRKSLPMRIVRSLHKRSNCVCNSVIFLSSTRQPCLLHLALRARVMLGQVETWVLSANVLFPFVLSGPSISTVISAVEVTIPAQAMMDLMKMPVKVGTSTETFIAA